MGFQPTTSGPTEAGVRLLLYSLVFTVITGILLNALSDLGAILIGFAVALPSVAALIGFVGILLIERGRAPEADGARRRARSALLVAAAAAAFLFASGLVLGFVYLPSAALWIAFRTGARFLAVLAVGLYLLWTAERIDPAFSRPLAEIALAFGAISAALGTGIAGSIAFGLVDAQSEIVASGGLLLLAISAFLFGLVSLISWVVVYSEILGRSPGFGGWPTSMGGA
jgi:hypothetical protein